MADISFQIGGDPTGFKAALAESQAAVTAAAAEMKSSFEGISGIFESLTGAVGLFTAALAGGAAFKEAIGATVELTTGALKLGTQFGISATRASDLNVALEDVHVSQDTLSAAGSALTKNLAKSEAAFRDVGIATRDSSGAFRNQLDILLDVTTHLATLKEGTDRNIEGQRLFGKAWSEVSPIVRLTADSMREASERAAALGLEVGGEQVAATQRYRAAMAGAHDVVLGVENAIGTALMPALTTMGEWFGKIGPGLVEAFRIALATVGAALRLLLLPLQIFWETLKATFQQGAALATTFATVMSKALHGDFEGASAAWTAGMNKVEGIGKTYWAKIVKDAEDAKEKIAQSFADAITGPKVTPTAAGGGASTDPDNTEKRKQLAQELTDYMEALNQRLLEDRIRLGRELNKLNLDEMHDNQRKLDELVSGSREMLTRVTQESVKGHEKLKALDDKANKDLVNSWKTMTSALQSSFASAITGMLQGTESFSQAVKGIFTSIENALVSTFVNIGVKWAETQIANALISKTTAQAGIQSSAAQAGAAGIASFAGAPWPVDLGAPAFGAAMALEAASFAAASASGGYDIPAGVNPVTQLHQREMVLPANLSDTIRGMAAGGGARAKNGTLNYQPVGSDHGLVRHSELAEALRQLGHQFKLKM